jgi:hypothetical protein
VSKRGTPDISRPSTDFQNPHVYHPGIGDNRWRCFTLILDLNLMLSMLLVAALKEDPKNYCFYDPE